MSPARRDFLKEFAAAGLLLPSSAASKLPLAFLAQAAAQAPMPDVDAGAEAFWSGFLSKESIPTAKPVVSRGISIGGGGGVEREAFFFHYQEQNQQLQAAMDIPPTDLLASGDVNVTVNVVAFRPSAGDRATFERLQNAALRIDLVQSTPVVDLVDTMAWTALAALHPDKSNKLPPIQNLSFDPSTASQNMSNIVLPGGQGQWAVNLFAQQKASFFSQMLKIVTQEVDRFAPVLGLPAISTNALQSFNTFFGAFHSGVEYLFKSNPVPVFATSQAMRAGISSRGLPLRSGTYVLVPVSHAETLTPDKLAAYDVKQGLLVPRNTSSVSLYSAAQATLPDVTYATIDVNVKPYQASSCGSSAKPSTAAARPPAADNQAPAPSSPSQAPAAGRGAQTPGQPPSGGGGRGTGRGPG